MTAPLVGVGAGKTDPREFLAALKRNAIDRELEQLAADRRFSQPAELAPITGLPPIIDLPKIMRERLSTDAAAPRFDVISWRTTPRTGAGSREDAIAALAASSWRSACTFGPEAGRKATRSHDPALLVQTRVELPPSAKSLDIRHLRAVVKNYVRKLHALSSNGRKCGHVRFRGHVEARVRSDGETERAGLSGLVRCASVWSCPTCAPAISSARAEQVKAVVTAHRAVTRTEQDPQGAVDMLTLTVPHVAGMRLKRLRRHVSKAWQLMQRGAPWRRLKEQLQFVGSISSREVTHGGNGFHPHLHILIAHARAWTRIERLMLEDLLFAQWCSAVERVPGLRLNEPSREHGISLVASYSDDYIAKLGLADELTRAIHKKARNGNRTPFEIMADYSRGGSARDEKILREYIRGMKGARQLTWSRGKGGAADLRKIYRDALRALEPAVPAQTDLGFESDEELLKREEEKGAVVATIPGRTWDALRRVMRRAGADAEFWIVSAAEHSGAIGVEAAIARAWYVGRELARKDPNLRRWLRWIEPPDPAGVIAAHEALARAVSS